MFKEYANREYNLDGQLDDKTIKFLKPESRHNYWDILDLILYLDTF